MRRPRAAVQTELAGMVPAGPPRPVSPQARAMSVSGYRGRKRTAPSPRPWECVTLNVDTAELSGWSIYVRGKLVAFGELSTSNTDMLSAVCLHALELVPGLPVVLVLEFWWGGHLRTCAGLRAQCDRWKTAWRHCGGAAGKVVEVGPSTWRPPVLGSYFASKGCDRDEVRRAEQSMAAGIVGRPVGPDASPAILIGHWSSHAPEVGNKIGKNGVRASHAAWGSPLPSARRKRAQSGVCRQCGCTDERACMKYDVPCSWVDAKQTLCSSCTPAGAP
jgi:hypothetical protein